MGEGFITKRAFMGLFDDVSKFLETQIDEFLKNNPHLELQALDEKLAEQARESDRLLVDLKSRLQAVEGKIRTTGEEIKRWHLRIEKAKQAGRNDLVGLAESHQAELLREGNQIWGQMEVLRDRIPQTEKLALQIQQRRQEVKIKLEEARSQRKARTSSDSNFDFSNPWRDSDSVKARPTTSSDPLEKKFASWEAEEELQRMKRKLGK
jgi:uncharacterized protein (TIGR04376 family)